METKRLIFVLKGFETQCFRLRDRDDKPEVDKNPFTKDGVVGLAAYLHVLVKNMARILVCQHSRAHWKQNRWEAIMGSSCSKNSLSAMGLDLSSMTVIYGSCLDKQEEGDWSFMELMAPEYL